MNDKYYHIKFAKGWDITLKNAWIRVEQIDTDDYVLGGWEFFLESIDNFTLDEKMQFRLTNDLFHSDYLCEVVKSYDNMLALKILEWQE